MKRIMLRGAIYTAVLAGLSGGLAACGGGGGSGDSSSANSTAPAQSMAALPLTLSDATSDDWACVGVKVLSIALVPQGGGAPVTVWSAPTQAPYINLEQLDQLGEILGNVSVPVDTYTAAILTIAANPGDVLLTTAANPPSGFPVAGGTAIASDQIQIQGANGTAGNLSVQLTVDFATPFTVSSSQSNGLDLEFDLGNPAFIVGHTPPAAAGATLWAVNFNGPVRHHVVRDLAALVLRHTYGTVTAVSSGALSVTKDFPVLPATNPETAISGSQSLTIDADASNGTIVYDLDAATRTVVENFNNEAGLANRYVRIAARYQQNGTLTAVRIWVSSDFAKVWLSPEGHVLNVNAASNVITVTNELGVGVPVTVNANTEFFFRTPQDAQADATAIGTGTGFLSNQQLVRGFKVHVGSMNPLGVPLIADSIDIETAAFAGHISNASSSGLTYTSQYLAANDNYTLNLNYIAGTTDNGFDDAGNQIQGFKWWNFTFPTTVLYGASGISQFVAATNCGSGSCAVDFGGTLGSLSAWGVSAARWGDGASNTSNWYLKDAILMPTPVPLGAVTTAFDGSSFAMTALGGTLPVTVDVDSTAGSATLVYALNRANGIVTVSPVDITSSGGMSALTTALVAGAPVKVYGVPLAPVAPSTSGALRAYVLVYYSGTMPSM